MRVLVSAVALALALTRPAGAEDPPTRDDFLRELISAEKTEQTERFGRVEGAYTPLKLDLLKPFRKLAKAEGADLRMVLVIGPNGPQQRYTMVAGFAQGDAFVLHGVIMADGRIANKGTTPIAREAFAYFVFELSQGTPIAQVTNLGKIFDAADVEEPEQVFDFLLGLWTPELLVTYASDLRAADREGVQRLMLAVNKRIRALRSTYLIEETATGRD